LPFAASHNWNLQPSLEHENSIFSDSPRRHKGTKKSKLFFVSSCLRGHHFSSSIFEWQPESAQSTPLTLADAVQKGLQNRMEMRAFEQRAQMTEHELKANQLRYIPQVSAGVNMQYNAILATSIVPIGALNPGNPTDEVAAVRFGTKWANGGGLTLSQVIYDPTIKGARELAELNGQLTEAQKAQRAEAIALAVAQAYYALLISEAEVGYAQSDSACGQRPKSRTCVSG
jgi:outer membrane protein TolC